LPIRRTGCDCSGGGSGFLQRYGGHHRIHPAHSGRGLIGALGVFGYSSPVGKNPLDLYFYMYQGAFGTWFSWQNS